MLRFWEGEDFFELGVAIEENAGTPADGDAYVTVAISSRGFSGRNDVWVSAADMSAFCRSLAALESSRRGEAALVSMSPDELHIKIHSVTPRGHLAVSGKTGYWLQRVNGSYWHAVEFGFEFDPSQIAGAVRLPWVRRYAARRPTES